MSRALTFGLLIALAVALALRCPQLAVRPMHNDEAVNAIKLRTLWEHGSYKYDPQEYHGPTLPYASFVLMKLIGPSDFVHFDEAELRLLTVIFGVGMILLLPLVADGLGRRATICAGLLTAISPAMVFYSRYYIHEMLLAFFTFLALAAGWRYTRSGKLAWALLCGIAVGLMQATKETFVLALGAAFVALLANRVWGRSQETAALQLHLKYVAASVAAWLITAVVLFTSFFANLRGPLDAVLTYMPWLHRAGGASPHIHPWDFYLERLIYFHSGKGPFWSEGLIFVLAIIGIVAIFVRKKESEGHVGFIRFLAIYAIVLTVIYSVIGYKTPWCLLNFWQPMILLAGVGAAALFDWFPQRTTGIAIGCVLLLFAAQLATQAWRSSVQYAADGRNPYVYGQTSPDILNLVERLDAIAQAAPQKYGTVVKVMSPDSDYWPLPWYLRQFTEVGWWSEVPTDPFAPVMIVSTKFQANLDTDKSHLMIGFFELRSQTFLELYVETNLWNSYLNQPKSDH